MGKFSIGARVRDEDGDEGVIVAKPEKGSRTVEYNIARLTPGFRMEWHKSELTPIQEPWQPKVGDRVRNIGEKAYVSSFPIGKGTGTVKTVYVGACDVISDLDGWVGHFFNSELEPVAAPGASEEPTTTPTANNDNTLTLTLELNSAPLTISLRKIAEVFTKAANDISDVAS